NSINNKQIETITHPNHFKEPTPSLSPKLLKTKSPSQLLSIDEDKPENINNIQNLDDSLNSNHSNKNNVVTSPHQLTSNQQINKNAAFFLSKNYTITNVTKLNIRPTLDKKIIKDQEKLNQRNSNNNDINNNDNNHSNN